MLHGRMSSIRGGPWASAKPKPAWPDPNESEILDWACSGLGQAPVSTMKPHGLFWAGFSLVLLVSKLKLTYLTDL